MTPFLQQIAARYYDVFGEKISEMAFVFPNRRAGLFFRKALSKIAPKPIFAPDILAINDLFFSQSTLLQADKVTLLFVLYQTYCDLVENPEPFDRFYFLGDMLLADFNDIDKYMADAQQVFSNISDLKEIESDLSWMSEEQKTIIRQFWQTFLQNKGRDLERQFSDIWVKIFEIYTTFKANLRTQNIGYDGMIFRDVIENDKALEFDYQRVVFVGFNALTTTELKLLKRFQAQGIGDYYFDYQSPEITEAGNIAAQFIDENRQFKSQFELDAPEKPQNRQVELIAIPSDIGQTKQVYRILDELQKESKENDNLRTAVVLPNEQLLLPMLHAIPENIKTVNVTMGFPLSLTPIAALMEHIVALQKNSRKVGEQVNFYHKNVLSILNHPYLFDNERENMQKLSEQIRKESLFLVPDTLFSEHELLAAIFRPIETTSEFIAYFADIIERLANIENGENAPLDHEFFDSYKKAINRIADNLAKTPIELSTDTFFRLLKQLTAGLTIAFKGEPLEGLQLMGTLETRALDFENVIITSFNEGIFPRKSNSPSIIPYNLRRAFGLPTYEYHDAIFAYNFYRMIYRAKRVFLIYDSRADGTHGELSRFATQMEYLYNIPLTRKAVGYEVHAEEKQPFEVPKTEAINAHLRAFCQADSEKHISASDINAYLDCPMRFYYSKVEQLSEPDEVEETIEANTFGSIYHRVMELLYQPFVNKLVTREILENLIKNKARIDDCLNTAFTEIFYKKRRNMPLLGQNLLVAHVIEKYVRKTLAFDRDTRAPFTYICPEKRVKVQLSLPNGLCVNLKGIIDRVDEKSGKTHIIDYKTGSVDTAFKSIEQLFDKNEKKRPKAIMQTFYYALIYSMETGQKNLKPLIYALQHLRENEIINQQGKEKEVVENFDNFAEDFTEQLCACLTEIFDMETPFRQTEDAKHCEYCAFKQICNRS